MPSSRNTKCKHYVFTLNNYEGCLPQYDPEQHSYLCWGPELAPTTGTPHLQGYVCFRNATRITAALSNIFGHMEPKRGTVRSAIDYCGKHAFPPDKPLPNPDFVEFGDEPEERSTAGGRATKEMYARVITLAKQGDYATIETEQPGIYLRSYHTLKQIAKDNMIRPAHLENVCGEWHWGESGTGKTTYCRTTYPDAYIKSRDRWWCGYNNEDVVICDDLDIYHVALAGLLKDWGDKWSFKAEEKGGYKWIRPLKFIVTSQYRISSIWNDTETQDALLRRFKIHHYARLVESSV